MDKELVTAKVQIIRCECGQKLFSAALITISETQSLSLMCPKCDRRCRFDHVSTPEVLEDMQPSKELSKELLNDLYGEFGTDDGLVN